MFASLPTKPHRQLQNGMAGEKCARCGKAASLAPCYTRPDTGEMYHYQCIMISVPLEKPIALEKATNPNRFTLLGNNHTHYTAIEP